MATGASREEIATQVKAINALHEKVVAACWAKCITKPKAAEPELTIADMACIDRCVPKYIEAQAVIRAELENARSKTPLDYP